ncbi:hypothetical protein ACV3K4_04375 [Clostridium perfringens]|uniref:hypothetical protein n=1 Tax=Clostridium perfringens TaxID=1502 RepID=UPI002A10673F|nr:hypothetical protein [Clostridium perfringens]
MAENFKRIKELINYLEGKGDKRTEFEDELLQELKISINIYLKESFHGDLSECPACGRKL